MTGVTSSCVLCPRHFKTERQVQNKKAKEEKGQLEQKAFRVADMIQAWMGWCCYVFLDVLVEGASLVATHATGSFNQDHFSLWLVTGKRGWA